MEANLQKYLAFASAVEYGSFTEAAKHLNYSQSAISRMIADLENEWQINLLERHKGGVRLTSDGTKILPYIRSVCEEYNKLEVQLDEMHGLKSGLIRIATFSSGASLWLPNIIKKFQKKYPNINYEVMLGDYTEIEQWIIDGKADCGFISLPLKSKLETIPLQQDEMLAILPKNHPRAKDKSFPIAAFADEPFMLLEKGNGEEMERILRENNLSPRISFSTWDDYAIMAMVESGLGISVLTKMIMERCPYNIIGKPLDPPIYRDVVLAFRGKDASSLALQRFVEYLPYRQA